MAMPVTYRILSGEAEWPRLYEFFERQGLRHDIVPSPRFARAIVAELDGEIIACVFMQVVIHMEPLVVAREHAGHVYLRALHAKAEEAHRTSVFESLPYFTFIDTAHVGRIAQAVGFEVMDGVSIAVKSVEQSFVSSADMRAT